MYNLNDIKTKPLILDGATGTQLQKLGMPRGVSTEQWALDNPGAVIKLQRAYMDAGSDAVYAPTFGANRVGFKTHGITVSVRDGIRQLVNLSREATRGELLVGGDMAPVGLPMPPMDGADFEELVDVLTEQAAALEEAGVDFFGVETQMTLREARASVIAARSVSDKPVFVSFTCDKNGSGIFGGDMAAALVTLQDMGVSAFGINCCGDLELLERLLFRLKRCSNLPLIVKPNAGIPKLEGSLAVYDMPPDALAAHIPAFLDAGARLIGGCCGTDERHIAAIREALGQKTFIAPTAEASDVCASERKVLELSPDIEVADLTLGDDVISDAAVAQAEGADVLYVRLRDEQDVKTLEENQFAIQLPLCLDCADGELLTKALRVYHGKPIVV